MPLERLDGMSDRTEPHRRGSKPGERRRSSSRRNGRRDVVAALDLGTNNCRLLVAKPAPGGFEVIDAFSRTVGLGEQLTATGALSDGSMERAISALKICASKIKRDGATHVRAIATEACRIATRRWALSLSGNPRHGPGAHATTESPRKA